MEIRAVSSSGQGLLTDTEPNGFKRGSDMLLH